MNQSIASQSPVFDDMSSWASPGGELLITAISSPLPDGFGSPVSIPEAQIYYWTRAWQDAENRALLELRENKGIRFKNAAEAIRWLLKPE